jgi:hypothetical protein
MHNARVAVIAGSTAAVVSISWAVAAQAQPDRPTPTPAEHRFVLVDHTGPTHLQDSAPNGPSVGDRYTFSEWITQNGRRVGTGGGTCTLVAVTDTATTQQCVITAALARGQLDVAGLATYSSTAAPHPVRYAITGGTGDYRTARGEVTVTPIVEGSDRIDVDVITG